MAHYTKKKSPNSLLGDDKVITVRLNKKHYKMLQLVAERGFRTTFSLSHTIRLLIEDSYKGLVEKGQIDLLEGEQVANLGEVA